MSESEYSDIEKKTISLSKDLNIQRELENIVSLFNRTLSLLKEDKEKIDEHLESLQMAYTEARGFGVTSEDGIVEDAITNVFKAKNEMAKRIEKITEQVLKIVTTKMNLQTALEISTNSGNGVNKAVDLSKFK